MSDNIRIKTTPGGGNKNINVNINQKFDFIEILSLKISQEDAYRRFCSDYGVVVGRVIVNNGVGVPNAKVSIFIPIDEVDLEDPEISGLYPYEVITDTNGDGIPYTLVPRNNRGKDNCFTPIGTFPSKREIQDNPDMGDIYCNYYKFTTTTNESGDFMLFGVPVGTHFLHVDADISDIGFLSQRPYDLIRDGASDKSFNSPTKFKGRKETSTLNQLKTSSPISVTVPPFWGDTEECSIGISRTDVNLATTITPNAIFMGSLVSDNDKNALSRTCIPRKKLGKMDELVTGEGRIEMIRKTNDDKTERFDVEGGYVIDGDGAWAYQIPMNREYMVTAEDGSFVPSEDPSKGIPTKAKVRFRVGMNIQGDEGRLRTRAKYLVPHNPDKWVDADFSFDNTTKDANFTELSWNKIYTVKNYISRTQARGGTNNRNFIGFKNVDDSKDRNPIPFNKMDTDINPLFTILCVIIKIIARIVGLINNVIVILINIMIFGLNQFLNLICKLIHNVVGYTICLLRIPPKQNDPECRQKYCLGTPNGTDCDDCDEIIPYISYITLKCEVDGGTDKEYAPGGHKCFNKFSNKLCPNPPDTDIRYITWEKTRVQVDPAFPDDRSQDKNVDFYYPDDGVPGHDCFLSTQPASIEGCDAGWSQCQAAKLADALDVFKFDFYNDWVNGTLYTFLLKYKVKKSGKERFCEVDYKDGTGTDNNVDGRNDNPTKNNFWLDNCTGADPQKSSNLNPILLFPFNQGVNSYDRIALKGGYIKKYEDELYYSPISSYGDYKLYATDIVSLGSVFDCDWEGQPVFYKYLSDTTFNIPPLVAEYETKSDGSNGQVLVTGYDTEVAGYLPGGLTSGLIANITCLGILTNSNNCNNIKRLSELGVGLDESRDTGPANNRIDNLDVEQDYVRGIFAYLNEPGITSINSVLIDSSVTNYVDYLNMPYNHFRGGVEIKSPRNTAIWLYKNSFYFYFGLNKGKTGLSKMISKYFTDCTPEEDVDFFVVATNIDPDTDPSGNATVIPVGAISIQPSGGVGPYTYLWSQITVGGVTYPTTTSTQNISGLRSGTYTVTVIDNVGNKTDATFTVPGPPSILCTVQSTNVTSNGGNNGVITSNWLITTPPYTVRIDNFDPTINGGTPTGLKETNTTTNTSLVNTTPLTAGWYLVTVSDGATPATTCQDIVEITEPAVFDVTLTTNNVTCFGASNGTAELNITGGVGPYLISWSNGKTGTFVTNLPSGTIQATVQDNNGVSPFETRTVSASISSPSQITYDTPTLDNGNCPGGALGGQITINNIQGGTSASGTYTTKLTGGKNNVNQQVTTNPATFTNLVDGTLESPYTITVSDDNGCEVVSNNLLVYVPTSQLTVSLTSSGLDATATISGGIFETNPAGTWGLQSYKLQWYKNSVPDGSVITINSAPTSMTKTYATSDVITVRVWDKSGDSDGCNRLSAPIVIQ